MSNEIRGTSPSGTLYARVMSPSGLWWNGSSFEAYATGNYANYDLTMTEQGNSGVYVADLPSGITTGGTYEYFVHRQSGGSPAEGDLVINTGKVDWSGSASISAATGSMTGSEFWAYVLRLGFKRTDKDTEGYEAITDAVQEMRRRFMFDEAETETTTTDTISSLGDFKVDLESDFGLMLGVILQDGTTAIPLTKRSKSQFDAMYPDINVTNDKGYPSDYCIYAGQIYIGPIPDSTSYTYRKNYSRRAGTVTAITAGVPFTNVFRDVLAENVMMRLYRGLQEYDEADRHEAQFEKGFLLSTRKELINSGEYCFTQKVMDC